jgi:hypothetical protein
MDGHGTVRIDTAGDNDPVHRGAVGGGHEGGIPGRPGAVGCICGVVSDNDTNRATCCVDGGVCGGVDRGGASER